MSRSENVTVGQVRAGYAFCALEEARHPARLRSPVLHAALRDQLVGVVVGDDVLGVERHCTQCPDRVIVRQHKVTDRLVGVFA